MYLASVEKQQRFTNVLFLPVSFEIVPCIIMVLTFIDLFSIVRKRNRHIAALHLQVTNRYNLNNISGRGRQHEKSIVHVVAASVVILFEICWVSSAYRAVCKYFKLCTVSRTLVQILCLFLFLSCAVNVFVYAFLESDIRQEMKTFLKFYLQFSIVLYSIQT